MEESYENLKNTHESIIKEFEVENEQNGVLIILNGEIQGFELFLNPEIYREFHKKILKSYIIDSKIENNTFAVNVEDARDIISKTLTSSFEKRENLGLEEIFEFENDDGIGTNYTYKNKIVHMSYFQN